MPAEQRNEVVSIVDYLEATLRKMDEFVSEIQAWVDARREIAVRLAVLRSASDPEVLAAAVDYETRVADDTPYENARPSEDVLREAHARYGTS